MSDDYEIQIGELNDHIEELNAENKELEKEKKILRNALKEIQLFFGSFDTAKHKIINRALEETK